MKITCENCGDEVTISNKKFAKRKCNTHKIVICPSCGKKNFVSILLKATFRE